jgi:hypothetical protein
VTTPEPPPGIRISDADREAAAARLHQALAEGRITLAELEERLAVVYAARYEADLRPPLADLPGGHAAVLAPVPQFAPDAPRQVLRTGMSTLRRSGDWAVPARLRLETGMGTIVLDFCDAPLPPAVDIEVEAGAGTVRLLVPDTATADVDGVVSAMGTVRSSVPSRAKAGATHFTVHGTTSMGTLLVRRRFRMFGRHF